MCQVVTAAASGATCQQMLAFLERANLFLVPLDEERRWYRLHDLFREALLAVLQGTQPELVPVLHCRAAGYYEAQGQWSEAIAHRLAAADFATAARLLEQTVEQFWLRGEAATMAHWVLALPQPLVREHVHLVLTTTLYLLYAVQHTRQEQRARAHLQARQLMARVKIALLPQGGETGGVEDALLHRRLRLLHLFLAAGDATRAGTSRTCGYCHGNVKRARSGDTRTASLAAVPRVIRRRRRLIRPSWHSAPPGAYDTLRQGAGDDRDKSADGSARTAPGNAASGRPT